MNAKTVPACSDAGAVFYQIKQFILLHFLILGIGIPLMLTVTAEEHPHFGQNILPTSGFHE
jgi:hypothetical protein